MDISLYCPCGCRHYSVCGSECDLGLVIDEDSVVIADVLPNFCTFNLFWFSHVIPRWPIVTSVSGGKRLLVTLEILPSMKQHEDVAQAGCIIRHVIDKGVLLLAGLLSE